MELRSLNIGLRSFTLDDIPRLVELANNKKVSENLRDGFPHPYSRENAEEFIRNCLNQNPVLTFAITLNSLYIGNIGLSPGTDVYRKSTEVGYFIGEPYWNKNIATKALKLITDYAFDELGFVRVHAGVFEYNHASQRVLEKCGYKLEGVFEKSVYKQGKLWNELRYAKIKVTD